MIIRAKVRIITTAKYKPFTNVNLAHIYRHGFSTVGNWRLCTGDCECCSLHWVHQSGEEEAGGHGEREVLQEVPQGGVDSVAGDRRADSQH